MGILDLPGKVLGKTLSRRSLFSMLGGFAAGKVMAGQRARWEQAKARQLETLLDSVTPYDLARGAGKLLAGWLDFSMADLTVRQAEHRFIKLLAAMDEADPLPDDRARSRFLVSKALFRLKGFKLSQCRYELYQKAALQWLRKNPRFKTTTRRQLFEGQPFTAEDLIATTHRMLWMLDNGHLTAFLTGFAEGGALKDDADYLARLIAATFNQADDALETVICEWFQAYCDFKIAQTHQHQAWIQTSIDTATGGLPTSIGMDLLNRAGKAVWRHRPGLPK